RRRGASWVPPEVGYERCDYTAGRRRRTTCLDGRVSPGRPSRSLWYTLTYRPPRAGKGRIDGPGDLRPSRPTGRAGGRVLRESAAPAGEVRRRRLLRVSPGRAPRHAARTGPGAGHLPRRRHAADAAHPAGTVRVLPAPLRPAPAHRGDLHARPALTGALRRRRGPGDRSLRDGVLQPAPPGDRGDLPGGARGDPPGAHERRARPSRAALHLPQRPDGPPALPEAASPPLVRPRPRGRRRVGGHQPAP